jgi:hypothetical protein
VARIRTIKPEFWSDEELSALPEATHILAGALLNYADDFGWFNANPALVRAACSPIREPSVSIPESLRSLQNMGYIRVGTAADGKRYGHVVKFDEHQRVSHPTPSKIGVLSIAWDDLGNPPEFLRNPPETFRPEQGTGNREQGKKKEQSAAGAAGTRKSSKVTFEQFVAGCRAKGEKPIPEDHPVFRFADETAIPVEFVRLVWREFRRTFGPGGQSAGKQQAGLRGWRAHFDNAVRRNWFKLWSFNRTTGECYLTDAGVALQREADAEVPA